MNPKKDTLYIHKLIPNVVTLIGLCFGLFSIKYAMVEQWQTAVILLVIAAFIDGFDGGIARLLNSSSSFGAQLDSLTDFINFGVAPALLIYLWKTHEIKGIGWAVALFFVICQALRLARFNVSEKDKENQDLVISDNQKYLKENFFSGVPAPTGAGLTLLPMIITFMLIEKLGYEHFSISSVVVIIYTCVIAFMMISTIPTFSVKKVRIKKSFLLMTLAGVCFFIIGLITEPWIVLTFMGLLYLISIPLSVALYCKLSKKV